MKNTVYFLITDGEELGLVGGDYFVKNPLFDPSEITMVTNFEARGSKGVPFMYRSSENNKKLLKILSENVDKKWSFSWIADIFKTMPNSSDLGRFINAGYKGLDHFFPKQIFEMKNVIGEDDHLLTSITRTYDQGYIVIY